MMERYDLPRERITIIPRGIDTAAFDPAAVDPQRIEALRYAWRVPPDAAHRARARPGRAVERPDPRCPTSRAPWSTAACATSSSCVAGENRRHAKYARAILKQAQAHGVARPVPPDRPLPRHAGRLRGRRRGGGAGDRAAGARPRGGGGAGHGPAGGHLRCRRSAGAYRDAAATCRRTCAPDGSSSAAIRSNSRARSAPRSSLDDTAYRAMAARARQFAEYMFSPAERRGGDARGLYLAAGARHLTPAGQVRGRHAPGSAGDHRAAKAAAATAESINQSARMTVDLWPVCTDPSRARSGGPVATA